MARRTRSRVLAQYLRTYHLAPRYRREQSITLAAADGTRLAGARLVGPVNAPATVVLVHGLANWSRTPRIHAFAQELSRWFDVVVPDLRGHGRSAGSCTLGRDEPLDVAAAVAAADATRPVVTVGVSLGAAAVLLHAATIGGVAGAVAVSPPARWSGVESEGVKRLSRYVGTRWGRVVLATVVRTRIGADCRSRTAPVDVVEGIAPAFTIFVADPADWYFDEEHARLLFDAAREPKELWWCPGEGHGSDLLTTALAARLAAAIVERAGAPPPPAVDRVEEPRPPTPSR